MTDTNQLLREYVETGSEPAFREIVSRYVDLVYSVAIRKLGGHEHLARDVVQTVFTDLARKASQLRAESCLGGWLHRHTCFISSTMRRAEQRRLAREQIAVEMNQNEPSEATWQRLAPMLDEAVDQLGVADRQAIILRFYERRDLRSVGAALGTNEDAAQKRLSRGEACFTQASAVGRVFDQRERGRTYRRV